LKISHQNIPVEIELTTGAHLFTSEPVEIGSYFHYKIFSQIAIPYSYDPEMQYITIAGTEDTSDKQLSIHTSLDEHPGVKDTRHLNSTGVAKANPNLWSDFIDKDPNIRHANSVAIRQTIDALVQQLLDAGVQGVIQTGVAPIVTPQNYLDYKAMFCPAMPDEQYPSLDDIIKVQTEVQSIYGGTITWALNKSFANVIGSTHDPKPSGYSSWIQLWADKCNNGYYPTLCSSYNYSDGGTPFVCGTDFVGGHVVTGTLAYKPANGSTVYIFPICKAHNNNNAIYMSMRYNPTGVVLNNYNQ
jgi:hypothetical protein